MVAVLDEFPVQSESGMFLVAVQNHPSILRGGLADSFQDVCDPMLLAVSVEA
jgi:hypothetical protein